MSETDMNATITRINPVNASPTVCDSLRVFRESSIRPADYRAGLCICYLRSGTLETRIDKRRTTLLPGDILIAPPGSQVSLSSNDYVTGVVITFQKLTSVAPVNLFPWTNPRAPKAFIDIYLANKQNHHAKLKNFLNDLISGEQTDTEQPLAHISGLIRSDMAYYFNRLSRISRKRMTTQLDLLQRVESIKQFIEENCTQKFNLENISRNYGMSKFALIRSFREAFDTTPHQYYVERKILQATKLLALGYSIKETSVQCGYPDIYSFSKQFKVLQGCPPGQMRKHVAAA